MISARTPLLTFLVSAACSLSPGALRAQDQWPVKFEQDGDNYQVFAPQTETMSGDRFTARAAVTVQRPGDKEPVFGALWGEGTLMVDRDNRLGLLTRFTVSDVRFPGITDQAAKDRIAAQVSEGLPKAAGPMSIDWLVASMETEVPSASGFSNDAPEIIYQEKPSALLYIDGDARYQTMKETSADDPAYVAGGRTPVERVVNTPFMLLRPQGGDHYLYGSGLWFRSTSIDGPWRSTNDLPDGLASIAEKSGETAALKKTDTSPVIPAIIVRHGPAELLDFDGAPRMEPVKNSDLLYATNTSRELFLDITSQQYYFLASGRWFSTRDLKKGPWAYVPSDQLPAAFAHIPEGTKKDAVLAHVSGTDAAREAALDASIPQTAQVDRNTATTKVTYQGTPEFQAIEGSSVAYAVNASTTVLLINGRYHVCDDAVWFESDTPDGPWAVSTAVPAEVNSIPPSSPVYNTRYVYIYGSTANEVYTGYTPGYLGCYVQNGCVVFGTGYSYPTWGSYWYPRPMTWGFNMFYDPWYGWGFGYGWGWNWYSPGYWGRWGGWGGWGGWGWGNPYYGWGWWGSCHHAPTCHGPRDGHHYGQRPSWQNAQAGPTGKLEGPRERPLGKPEQNLYATQDRPGVAPASISRPEVASSSKPVDRVNGKDRPSTMDHFTDARGDVYRTDRNGADVYQAGSWTKVDKPMATNGSNDPLFRPNTNPDMGQRPVSQDPIHQPNMNPDMGQRPSTGQQLGISTSPNTRPAQRPDSRPIASEKPSTGQPAYQSGSDIQRIERQRERADQHAREFGNFQRPPSRPNVSPSPARGGGPGRPSSAGSRGGGGSSGGGRSKRR